MAENDEYVLRGQRVRGMSPQQIQLTAYRVMKVLNINKRTLKRMDVFIEELWDRHRINVEINDDATWLGYAEALCDPSSFTIIIPNRMYTRMTKDKEKQSIFIFFHELGHLLLGHKPALHYSLLPPTQFEDAEWQADFFAELILDKLGEGRDTQHQIELRFE